MKIYILLYCFILMGFAFPSPVTGQESDSLKAIYSETHGLAKINLALQIAGYYHDLDPDSSLRYNEIALILARKNKHILLQKAAVERIESQILKTDSNLTLMGYYSERVDKLGKKHYKEMMHTLLFAGSYAFHLKLYDISLDLFSNAQSIAREKSDYYSLGLVYKNLSDIHFKMNNTGLSLRYAKSAFESYTAVGSKTDMAFVLNLIGHIFWESDRNDSALYYYLKSYEIYSGERDSLGMASEMNNLGNVYRNLSQEKRALDHYITSHIIYENMGDSIFIAGSAGNIGMIYAGMGEDARADEYFEKAMTIHKKLNNWRGMIMISNNMGQSCFTRGEYIKSLEYLNYSLGLALANHALPDIRDIYKYRSEVYIRMRDFRQAYDNFKFYREIKDSLVDVNTAEELNELAVKYFTTQMVKESKILTNEKEIQQLKIGRARTVRYFIVAMSSLVLIIILVILSRFRVRKRSALALEKKNKDLEDVVGKLKMSGILLKKLNADKEALFHMITRDLRQPIRDLLARSEQLAKDYGNIPETGFQEKLDDLRNYSVLIYSIFDNLVNISALQAGKSAPEKGKHNLINILFDSIHNATENLSAQFSFNTLDFKDISLYTDFDLAVKAFNKLFQSLRGAMPDIQYTLSVKRKSSAVHLAFETENAVDFSVYFNKTSLDNLKSATGYEKPYTTDAGMLLLKKLKLDAYYAMECFRLLDIVPCIEKNEGKETMVLKIKQ